MKRALLGVMGLLVLWAPAPASAQDKVGCFTRDPEFEGSHVSKPGPHAIGSAEVVELASEHDGVKIQMAVIRPAGVEKAPVIVFASPYMNQNLNLGCNASTGVTRLVENYVPHGYAVGVIAVRGTADSGGCSDLMGPAERADLDQGVRWFGTQPWSSGAVGMIGVSYDGSTPWEVAAAGNPHLKTIVPISGVNDVWHLMYRNGTPEIRGAGVLNALYWLTGWQETNPAVGGRSPENTVSGFVCPEAFQGFAHAFESTATGQRDAAGWWAERNSRPGVEKNWRGSILLVHGLQDWNVDPGHDYPWVNTLEARGVLVHHLLPQWGHAWPDRGHEANFREDWADVLLEWFDRHLRGLPVDVGPRVQVQDDAMRWREGDTWPPVDAVRRRYHLAPGGETSEQAPGSEENAPVVVEGPPTAPTPCEACPTWKIPARPQDWRVAGLPVLRLAVTPTGPAGHVAATLTAVSPAGARKLIGWGQVDLRFPEGAETAQPVVPGQRMTVNLPIEPLDGVVPESHALEIRLSQGTYGDHAPSSVQPVVVHAGPESWAELPEPPEPPACAFFHPPGAAEPDGDPMPPAGRHGTCPRTTPGPSIRPPFGARLERPNRRPRALRGTATGPVTAVEVAVRRQAGRRCTHLTGKRRFTRPGTCRARWLRATGTSRWSLRLPRLRPGRYAVAWRAIAADGRVDRTRTRRLRVR